MSWNIEASGTKEAVQQVLDSQTGANVPAGIKDIIKTQLDQLALEGWSGDPCQYQAYIKSFGHFDGNGGNATIEVKRMACGLKAPPPTATE